MKRLGRTLGVLAIAGLFVGFVGPGIASAHEHRIVAGDYAFMVGFLKEPAYEGESNGIDLTVTRRDTNEGVQGLEQTLHVEVTMGGDSLPLPLLPRFRQPGVYSGEFVPTRPGTYYFLINGTIEGRPVQEVFESGPGRFNDVDPIAKLQFPDTVPSGVALQRAIAAADGRAATATVVGVVGIAVGLLGVVVALAALRGGQRRAVPTAETGTARGSTRMPSASSERL
jgi:hypothetical protein